MDFLLLLFEFFGTLAFAASGALTGIAKKMDIFGILMLAVIVAVGGGIIRDLVLGITPPAVFRDPSYAVLAAGTAVILCIPAVRRILTRHRKRNDTVLLLMDTVGLASFTVVGIQTAYSVSASFSPFLLVFVGVVTGVGGGVLRDVFAGDMPGIFVRQFYASAAILGAVVCVLLWNAAGSLPAMSLGMIVIILLRLAAEKYHWGLYHPKQ